MACALFVSGCGIDTGLNGSPPAADGKTPILYRVRPGDTIWGIGQKYGLDGRRIAAWNELDDPNQLEVGQQLIVGFRADGGQQRALQPSHVRDRADRTVSSQNSQVAPTKERSSSKGDLGWPLHAGRVISGFGPRLGSFHDGIDIAAETGTPVYAAHSGTVIHAGDDIGGYGNIVILRHRSGLISVYAHNSSLDVQEGDQIGRGAKIAEVGATGHATGPHLHFEVRVRDRQGQYVAVDPLPLLTDPATAHPRYRINEGLRAIFSRFVPSSS